VLSRCNRTGKTPVIQRSKGGQHPAKQHDRPFYSHQVVQELSAGLQGVNEVMASRRSISALALFLKLIFITNHRGNKK
jgi:hypothetical protein